MEQLFFSNVVKLRSAVMLIRFLILHLTLVTVVGCNISDESSNENESNDERYFSVSDNVVYDSEKLTFIINGVDYQNIIQSFSSADNNHIVFTSVNNTKKIDIITIDLNTGNEKLLSTIQNGIPFDPVINNNGDYAYSLHINSVSMSEVYFNNNLLELPTGLYKNLSINDGFLIGHYSSLGGKENNILIYDFTLAEMSLVPITVIPDKVSFSDDQILVKGLSFDGFGRSIYEVDPWSKTVQFISKLNSPATEESILLEKAVEHLVQYDPMLSLACASNDLGRLTWYVSYRLEAMSYLARTNSTNISFPFNHIISKSIDCLLGQYEFDTDKDFVGWTTKKYSIDKNTELSLLIDNTQILYVLLKLANNQQASPSQLIKIQSIGKDLFNYYEDNYDASASMYKFKKGINFWADGVWLPWNMQNTYALALIELYKSTNNYEYLSKVIMLFESFKNELVVIDDHLIWHYWPDIFYTGWTAADYISINTPERAASEDVLYEDTIHGSINVLFLLNYYRDIEKNETEHKRIISQLNNTLSNLETDNKYSRFVSGNIEYDPASIIHLPYHGGGWSRLGSNSLKNNVKVGIPNKDVFFEGDKVFSYLSFLSDYE